ncbi:MAG: murein hydrolase activator EnvC family protein [Thermoanaerobaculia bacterium]
MRAIGASLVLLAALAPGAQVAPVPDPDTDRRADLQRIQASIAGLEKQLAASQKSQASLSEDLKRLELKVEIARQENRLLAARREEAAATLARTEAERAAAWSAALESRRVLAARARVLQRFGRFGYFRVLLEARNVPAFLQGLERLDALARRDGRLLARHRQAASLLAADSARVATLKAQIDGLYAASRQTERRAASLKAERESLLAREKSLFASRREEVEVLTDKAQRLERLLETLSRQSDGQTVDPSGGIRPWKGVLDWPARGAVVETFGRHRHPKFDAWTVSNGIALALPAGSDVRAVYAGKAVYAQWLAEYGNLVILDHGDGVFTLYAWLRSVSVTPGSYIAVGTTLGVAGPGPGRDEPGLYFEVRDRQKANDPVAWLR